METLMKNVELFHNNSKIILTGATYGNTNNVRVHFMIFWSGFMDTVIDEE